MNITVKIDAETYGLTRDQIVEGVLLGFENWKNQSGTNNPNVKVVTSGPADFYVKSKVIYLGKKNGKHLHGRGLADIPGNTFYIHSGLIPKHQSNRGEEHQFQFFHSSNQLGKISQHEIGHCLGLDHVNDINCIMHSNASGEACTLSKQTFRTRFPNSPEDTPFNPDGTLKSGIVLDAVNIPEVARGAVKYKGEWFHIIGDSIVLNNANVTWHKKAASSRRVEQITCQEIEV